jgi:hypothetical protein
MSESMSESKCSGSAGFAGPGIMLVILYLMGFWTTVGLIIAGSIGFLILGYNKNKA